MEPAPDGGRTQRVRLVYSGRVQGVGFRYTALEIAQGFAVTGFVRNLPDGTVELEAQGASGALESFLARVAGRFERHIRGVARTTLPLADDETQFEIRA